MHFIIFLIVSFITTVPLFAESTQWQHSHPQENLSPALLLKTLDSNKDGRLNYLEAMANSRISARFLQIDLNNNGFLNLQELSVPNNRDSNQLKMLLNFASLQCI